MLTKDSFGVPGFNPNFNPAVQPNNITNPVYMNQKRTMAVPSLHPAPCHVYAGSRRVYEYCKGHGIDYAIIHPTTAASATIPALVKIFGRVGSMKAGKMTNMLAMLAIGCWVIAIAIAYTVLFPLVLGLGSFLLRRRKPAVDHHPAGDGVG